MGGCEGTSLGDFWKHIFIFIYLSALGLTCSTWDLGCIRQAP